MKIGIMSDSHDHLENIKKSVVLFKAHNVDHVLHLGDYVSPNAVLACKGVNIVGIYGNNDGDKFRMASAFNSINSCIKGDFYEFEKDGLLMACYHGSETQLKDALIECGKYNIVIYGHTHQCKNEIIGNTLVLNPGTVHGFGLKATIAILNTETCRAEFIHL